MARTTRTTLKIFSTRVVALIPLALTKTMITRVSTTSGFCCEYHFGRENQRSRSARLRRRLKAVQQLRLAIVRKSRMEERSEYRLHRQNH